MDCLHVRNGSVTMRVILKNPGLHGC
ncbi:E3 SUMO-protein ligase MMS21 [Bienertia sinuspersici]